MLYGQVNGAVSGPTGQSNKSQMHTLPSYRQDNTCHGLHYTSFGALAGTRNSSMGPPRGIDPMTHYTMSEHYHGAMSLSLYLQHRY